MFRYEWRSCREGPGPSHEMLVGSKGKRRKLSPERASVAEERPNVEGEKSEGDFGWAVGHSEGVY